MRKIGKCIVAGLLLLGLLSWLTACSKESKWQKKYDLGMKYLEEGNYEEALTAFDSAVSIDDKRAEAYIKLAEIYTTLGDTESAENIKRAGYEKTGVDDLKVMSSEEKKIAQGLAEVIKTENLENICDYFKENYDSLYPIYSRYAYENEYVIEENDGKSFVMKIEKGALEGYYGVFENGKPDGQGINIKYIDFSGRELLSEYDEPVYWSYDGEQITDAEFELKEYVFYYANGIWKEGTLNGDGQSGYFSKNLIHVENDVNGWEQKAGYPGWVYETTGRWENGSYENDILMTGSVERTGTLYLKKHDDRLCYITLEVKNGKVVAPDYMYDALPYWVEGGIPYRERCTVCGGWMCGFNPEKEEKDNLCTWEEEE